jgi:uncharacterized protein (DUF1684 family)
VSFFAGGAAALTLLLAAPCLPAADYPHQIEQWRAQREAALKADDGWLTVVGLFWLEEGPNPAGNDPHSSVLLPRGPAHAGVFERKGDHIAFRALADGFTSKSDLRSDADGKPDLIQFDGLTFFIIQRGGRFAVRVKDTRSVYRTEFMGVTWFPIDERYRVEAKFVPYDPPRTIAIPTILGTTEKQPSPGYAAFTLHDIECRLDAVTEGNELFFIFNDRTANKQTYPSGRFLKADLPKDGKVILDFNKAYNPPCAFTPYATCPLPPTQNRLPLRILAGELNYAHP